jgi:AbrB family looped-hinge helix DNA binding protein
MGKRGTLVLPAKLRKEFGLTDGSLLVTESRNGEITIRPAYAIAVEVYTPERKAEFALNNALSKEDWDTAAQDVRAMGLDPLTIPNTDPNRRQTLPTNAELDAIFSKIEARQQELEPA